MQSLRRVILVGAVTASIAAPAAALGAAGGVDLPGWMQRMMDDAPPETQRMMRSPGMEQMMRSPGMRAMMEPGAMDEMMQSPGMRAVMGGALPEPKEERSR